MGNLHSLETNELIEMLVKQTAQLTAKIADRDPQGAAQYEYEIAMIQAEINSRQQPKDNTTISDMGIEFTSPSAPASGLTDPGSQNSTE
jgi:hypothetical protein